MQPIEKKYFYFDGANTLKLLQNLIDALMREIE
jgi:hypothetical protein